ncbi:low specificity L-threonine aldolase [Lutimaribacter sp. EGI FJ00015]|uniref:Low specificity L-threonine aldolase n=1 Tax=Lutimaribacter degradans TaxID=2945989 RepID=A0ACC5ZXW1_9RHOB|nr:low specificity L-threonine aldolase [Lutimaribacter sp. EGI FJ00013]MCM2562670.1 low specificity L-threonine aldolase [Lutimaribacter sp. EGI FJ00013]MCO0613827.1 low specificity L-threonine aldolase [Lutimaribacter sp. EGI FJ00015]MCO0636690.1 low specificity L-threonine aldolase [Lutimaribacter sp. EGI FJ00014]
MFFASDNAGPAHPSIMQALIDANAGYALPYGADTIMERVRARIRELFEAPEAAVYLVATGTAANSLALACMSEPWQTVFCSPVAHIHEDECNAPEFYMGGAKLTLVGDSDKMTPDTLHKAMAAEETRGVHGPQRGPVSITQVTEKGRVYSLEELAALTGVARDFGQKAHLDGARFANALVALGCSPAEMTWKAGIDAVSFGGTKNGCPGVEAVIFFNPEKAWEFELRRKRGAHLFSKHRYLSAQMEAYLTDDLWLTSARAANANCRRLADGLAGIPGVEMLHQPEANIIFAQMPRAAHQRLNKAGAMYYVLDGDLNKGDPDEPLPCRLVADWSISAKQIDQFVEIAKG